MKRHKRKSFTPSWLHGGAMLSLLGVSLLCVLFNGTSILQHHLLGQECVHVCVHFPSVS